MTKLLFGSIGLLLIASVAFGFLDVVPPEAAIEYNSTEATTLHGSAEAFSKITPILLHDIGSGSGDGGEYWLNSTVTQLTTLRGYAHVGGSEHMSQADANKAVNSIELWRWHDSNGNGEADSGDTTTEWDRVLYLSPQYHDGDGTGGNVVGYEIDYPFTGIHTSTWQGNLLQKGNTISLDAGKSYLLLIRCVDISGNSNLMTAIAGLEQWDNGAVDGVGSDIAADKYMTADGHTPGTTDQRLQDDDIVWIYVPRLK